MSMNPTMLWLLGGSILCLMELFLPTAFVQLVMGLSALVVAAISLILPYPNLQVIIWLILSLGGVFLTRRFLPKARSTVIEETKLAETLTEILPGKTGRVIYEGNSWSARCDDENRTIEMAQKVIVVGREGNILIVVPESLVRSK